MSPLKSERGVAIMVAMFAMVFLLVLATEVSYDTNVEFVVAAQKVNQLKAYYAAKSGVELSLFRISMYKKALAQFGDQVLQSPEGAQLLNQIWEFPFAWPPIMPDDIDPVAKDKIDTSVKESLMDAQMLISISGEGGKIDINDLGSPVEEISKAAMAALLTLFETEKENNDDFEEKYGNDDFQKLVNNIADWVDENSEGRNDRLESNAYDDVDEDDVKLPPNRAFRTIEELRMVAGMNDDFFDLLKDRVTVYGTKGINPNTATELVLKSLDSKIDDEAVGKILKRRSQSDLGGPFKNDDDFFGFLDSIGVNTRRMEELKFPFYYDAEYNFRITSTGTFGNVQKTITAISFDIENLSQRYAEFMKKSEEDEKNEDSDASSDKASGDKSGDTSGSSGGQDSDSEKNNQKSKYKEIKGRPTVVYWQES